MSDWLAAIILGLVEGLTEFIPVSSTGHMLLLGHFMGFESAGKTFEIVIQLGALLAIVSIYFRRLWTLASLLQRIAQSIHPYNSQHYVTVRQKYRLMRCRCFARMMLGAVSFTQNHVGLQLQRFI